MKYFFYLLILAVCVSGCSTPALLIERPHKSEMLQNFYLERARKNLEAAQKRIAKAKTKEDALKLVKQAQAKVRKSFGSITPLSPVQYRKTGMLDYPDYTVEKLLIKTREGFTMSAGLFLPKNGQKKFPAVIVLSGHTQSGRLGYRLPVINLVKRGFAVLNADPIHQGERRQFKELPSVVGHNVLNRQLLAVGEDFAQWRLNDAVQLVNFLESRKEIDPARIGVQGNSGGGTMTAFLAAYDRRIAAAAPACYITTFYHNILSELPADGEQMPSRFFAEGGEMIDLILAHAPKPYRILAQKYDFFDIRGAFVTYEMAKKIYKLLGAEENISMTIGTGEHGFNRELREGSYQFWSKYFNIKCDPVDRKITIPTVKELYSTPTGQVLELPGEKNAQQLIAQKALALKKERAQKKWGAEAVKKELFKVLNIPQKIKVPYFRQLRHARVPGGTPLFRMGVETDKGILVTIYSQGRAHFFKEKMELLISEKGSYDHLAGMKPFDPAFELRSVDCRGCGDSMPYGGLYEPYDQDYHYASLGVMWDEPLIGRKVFDILNVIRFLPTQGVKEIRLRSEGLGIIPAIFAAVLSDVPVKLYLEGPVPTYTNHALDPNAPLPQSFIPGGILKVTDLDELVKLFPDRFIIRKK